MQSLKNSKLIILAILTFPLFSFGKPFPADIYGSNPLMLEVNMISSNITHTALSDTLSITIYETTTGDEYELHSNTGSINISMQPDKHYFIYMSKTGSVTQFIEFQTAGSLATEPHQFFADYDPVSLAEYDGYSMNYPMSVIKFSNNDLGTPTIENVGINVLFE